ncbi:hypothetical protein PoB_005282200 [Plakobranchus ocellatus]|uniref:Uncharacterized protein n=1 Tax=Plakobranchus ocellatus TaxID=259542 RepID=A0AAV4C4L2_9GAST|nr:hypothetical protein PoB_005282200 [Plakobranchus ocellatus]
MQSELLAHINGLFTGRTRRKSELPEPVGIDSTDKTSGIRFRRKSETQSPVSSAVSGRFSKLDPDSKYSGLNLVRVANMTQNISLWIMMDEQHVLKE